MIQIYLCDDNKTVLDAYKTMFQDIAKKYGLDVHITLFQSGEQLLFYYEDAMEEPEVIFLDIMMDGENGLESAKRLRAHGCRSELVFLTSNPEFVFDSFDVSPTNYILKNQVSRQRLEDIFLRAVTQASNKSKAFFPCENGSVKHNIPLSSICYFEVANRTVTVYYDKTSFGFYSSLEEVAKKLNSPAFLRTHRSYMVHLPYVEQIQRGSLTLIGGYTVPVGITYSKKIKENINHYFSLYH